MSSHTELVNVDAETAPKLAEWVAGLLGGAAGEAFSAECSKLIGDGNYSQLVLKFIDQHEAILALENEGDIEGYFQALVSITIFDPAAGSGSSSSSGGAQENLVAIQKAVDVLVAKTDKAKLRLRVLVSLFNMSTSARSKHFALTAILKYAISSGQAALVQSYHKRVVAWVEDWALPVVDKRNLYLLVSEVLEANKEPSLALSFFILYLSGFGKDAALPAEAHALAITAVKSAVKSPVTSFADRNSLLEVRFRRAPALLLSLLPCQPHLASPRLTSPHLHPQSISQQQATGALAPLLELLRIVCTDTLPAYRTYEAKQRALMTEHGIAADEMATKMRLLTLCSLGVQEQAPSYARVAKELDVAEDDVELWVVDAIAAGLLEANMDQFQRVVTITRCAHRSFGVEHWQGVKAKLAELDKKVQSVLAFFDESSQQQAEN